MAMRPRGGGAAGSKRTTRSGVVRPVYEDFSPVSEWQQDDESHILNIYLPGFMKEQIKVSTEGRNTIRVRGERLVAGNKWSRFVEDFQVPDNGEMNSVRAKFHGGILILTVPKEKVSKSQGALLPPRTGGVDDIRKQPTPQKGQVKAIPEVVSQATDVKGGTKQQNLTNDPEKVGKPQGALLPPPTGGVDDIRKQPTPQKAQVKAIPDVVSQATDVKGGTKQQSLTNDPEKVGEPEGALLPPPTGGVDDIRKQPNPQKGQVKAIPEIVGLTKDMKGGTKPQDLSNDPETSTEEKSLQHLKALEAKNKEKHVASEKQDDATKEKEGKETKGRSELPEAETIKTKKLDENGATGIPEKNAANKELYGASKNQKRKKAMAGLTELNEERQLLVNMGVAMLVIVALTAYVTYNFASTKHKN